MAAEPFPSGNAGLMRAHPGRRDFGMSLSYLMLRSEPLANCGRARRACATVSTARRHAKPVTWVWRGFVQDCGREATPHPPPGTLVQSTISAKLLSHNILCSFRALRPRPRPVPLFSASSLNTVPAAPRDACAPTRMEQHDSRTWIGLVCIDGERHCRYFDDAAAFWRASCGACGRTVAVQPVAGELRLG